MRKIGAFVLGLASVLLVCDVALGVTQFMLVGERGPWWGWTWQFSLTDYLDWCCLATAVCALAGAAAWQVHARRERVSGAINWLAAAAIAIAAGHISFFTPMGLYMD